MNRDGLSRTAGGHRLTQLLRLWWSDESAAFTVAATAIASLPLSRWRYRQVDRQEEDASNRSESCGRRSTTDGRLEYPIGKDEARERPEMSTPVGCRIRSSSTDKSALSETPFTVSRALPRVPECSCSSLLRKPCRAQKDPYMTLSYPFTVREKHRRLAGPSGDES